MEIKPYLSVGNLRFSDSREIIREKLQLGFEKGIKAYENIKEYYDYFEEIDLFAYFDQNDKLWAFEFFSSAPVFNGIDIFSLKYPEVLSFFLKLDPEMELGYNDFLSLKYGVGGNTNDDPEDESASLEAFIVFREGYYDRS